MTNIGNTGLPYPTMIILKTDTMAPSGHNIYVVSLDDEAVGRLWQDVTLEPESASKWTLMDGPAGNITIWASSFKEVERSVYGYFVGKIVQCEHTARLIASKEAEDFTREAQDEAEKLARPAPASATLCNDEDAEAWREYATSALLGLADPEGEDLFQVCDEAAQMADVMLGHEKRRRP